MLDYNNPRVAKARFYKRYARKINLISGILIPVLFIIGWFPLWFDEPIGYFIWSFIPVVIAVMLWIHLDLKPLLPTDNTLSGKLDREVLANLSEHPTSRDIAMAVATTNGGKFFAKRFGLSLENLVELSETDPTINDNVWQKAINIHSNLSEPGNTITAATIVAALLLTQPKLTAILPDMKIDEEDIIMGANWNAHVLQLIVEHKQPKMDGGIGRDWAFGYTPTLAHFGVNLSKKYGVGRSLNVRLDTHTEIIEKIEQAFTSGQNNIALVGAIGTGKTTIVDSFAETIMNARANVPDKLRFNQVFALDAAAIVSAAKDFGGIEKLLNKIFWEAHTAKNIILFFDDAELFFEDGNGSIDISNLIFQVLDGEAVKIIMAMNKQAYLQLSTKNPALGNKLNRVTIKSTTEFDTMRVLQDNIIGIEHRSKVTFTYQALREIYLLSERYIDDVVQPQRAIVLARAAVQNIDQTRIITDETIRTTVENMKGVKIGTPGSSSERNKLLNLEDLIHKRMVNQTTAVNAVADALRRSRSGVGAQNRPIGTFLFLGPTGVGKTELAKSLAAVYFGDEDNMVRIDLNNYVTAKDVNRLIEDGATNSESLSAQIRKNPFSVVLLDEIEKAHPNVLTALLQVLDEGILRDVNNREVSFRDAIIIATSNAGADMIREMIGNGEKIEDLQTKITDTLISEKTFAPEFLNRFDEIAVFRPLNKKELLQVTDIILKSINLQLNVEKIRVEVDDDGKALLVDEGYDPRLGARPLRRVIQKTVENTVSKKMLAGELKSGETLSLTREDIAKSI